MSSKSPPLAVAFPPARPPLIHWHAVSVAASVGVFLIAGVFAWIATHPAHKDRGLPVVLASHPAAVDDLPTVLAHPPAPPVLQLVSEPAPAAPRLAPPADPPPLPRPAPAPAAPPRPAPVVRHPTETYGTQVNFLGIPEEAAEQARREKKLLFVLHVSGNFEESCFT